MLKRLKITPYWGRVYLFLAAVLLSLPSVSVLYPGHAGRVLVATPLVMGQPFEKSVVYLQSHTLLDAFGIIVNKPSVNSPLFFGGPVDYPGYKALLHEENGVIVLTPVTSANRQERVFAGYAGWWPFQLNREIVRGAWDVIDADPELLFRTPPDKMWEAARARVLKKIPVEDKSVL